MALLDKMDGIVEDIILKSRHVLKLFYLGLAFELLKIALDYFQVLWGTGQEDVLTEHMLQALTLLDITMVANLIWLISAGSNYVFVTKYPYTSDKPRPRSLAHVSSGLLKEKMAGSLIGVSSVHLLKIFLHLSITHDMVNWVNMAVLIVIHLVFILGLFAFNQTNAAPHHQHPEEKLPEKEKEHAPVHS